MKKLKVAILGSGSFGTALGTVSARAGHSVYLYTKNPQTLIDVNTKKKNLKYFPEDIELPPNIIASDNLDECLLDSQMIIHAIPVQSSYNFMKEHSSRIPNNIPYIISSKGILLQQKKFFSDVWEEIFPSERNIHHCLLSGPSFAIELMKNNPTVVTIACKNEKIAKYVQNNLHTANFRSYISTDIRGVEIGGALKNPLAIAAGICEGLGYGINSNSAMVTRGLLEMSLFSEKFGGNRDTLWGLSGVGDVMLTCLGALSRNKSVGMKLAKGVPIDEIVNTSKEVAEGVPTIYVLDEIIKEHNLNMPIFKTLSKIVKGQVTPTEGLKYLMIRDLESENQLRI
jgi:glycerol-3-phosphate dehydrogenase